MAGERAPDGGTATDRPGAAGLAGPRGLAYAALAGLAGGGLALYASTRTWSVDVLARPPLPDREIARTGAELLPWLPALAVVALAGAAAVLATRGRVRRAVGVLLALVGVAVAVGGGYALLGRADVGPGWPVLCLLGGLLATAGAVAAVRYGHRWPVMGARYERTSAPGGSEALAPGGRVEPERARQAWDAIDRGEDPTV
ncbi:Trp biosynthesis-associated membrane protein [Plantactinospora sp. GCM10030261]|uniref:Trp biosynthesis-associated membrane protein n=1 Tax=Plantactinospora sp. GCM10030261 TaxID=3273420 RepID=UPI0036085B32